LAFLLSAHAGSGRGEFCCSVLLLPFLLLFFSSALQSSASLFAFCSSQDIFGPPHSLHAQFSLVALSSSLPIAPSLPSSTFSVSARPQVMPDPSPMVLVRTLPLLHAASAFQHVHLQLLTLDLISHRRLPTPFSPPAVQHFPDCRKRCGRWSSSTSSSLNCEQPKSGFSSSSRGRSASDVMECAGTRRRIGACLSGVTER
jgi:hypothetical protein